MIERLYIHNFRCFENFELITKEMPTALLLGAKGSGKSSVRQALTILQRVGRGINRVDQLLRPEDFSYGHTNVPIRIEIEASLAGRSYKYMLAVEFLRDTKSLRVFEEHLIAGGQPVYTRSLAQVTQHATPESIENPFGVSIFLINGQTVALSIIQSPSEPNDLATFKDWLARMIILAPIPSLMSGDSSGKTGWLEIDGKNFGEWFSWLLAWVPAAYSQIEQSLRSVMPDFGEIQQIQLGPDGKRMTISFGKAPATFSIPFNDLSDGEKCLFLGALVVATKKAYGSVLCFWDEPDNYISLSEVGHFFMALRRSFNNEGQLLITSHNPEGIRKFADENTLVLFRNSHLEPTVVRRVAELAVQGDLVEALIRGDVGP